MKKTLILVLVLFFGLVTQANDHQPRVFRVTITNLTKGQPLTPPVVAVHSSRYQLLTVGKEASQGLAELAQDGVTSTLEKELSMTMNVVSTRTGMGVILPGQSSSIEVKAKGSRLKISVVAMLARTNDAILFAGGLSTKLRKGHSVTYIGHVYDAGVEDNLESCDHIPAPPCGKAMVSAGMGEGFIHPHPGIQNIGDLDPLRDVFGSRVARIEVKRIH